LPRPAERKLHVRYSAFISYSHRDQKHARWLHRALETYRVPAHLRNDTRLAGELLGARLKPVFRDRDELASAADLAQAVQAALADAGSLIVVCSPEAARSQWVNAEIRHFAALGRRERVLCIIVDGTPRAADPSQECLPPALFDDGAREPLAADIRTGQDSRDDARLKLISAVLGIGYDELRRREHARRVRRLTAIAAGATAGLLITATLAVSAYMARNDAVRQRDIARERSLTAERTVEFVKGMFAVSDPSEARGSTITAREILDRGVRDYARALQHEPVVKAEIGLTLSEVYGALGLYRQSDSLVRSSDTLVAEARTVQARRSMLLGESQFRLGEYEEALANFSRGVDQSRIDENARETVLPRALVGLGQSLTALDRFDEAHAVLEEARSINEARGSAGARSLALSLETLALNALYAGELDEARPLLERANALRLAEEGENSPSVSDNLGTLATIAYLEGNSSAAETLLRERLAIDEKVLGPQHPDVAATCNNIARILIERRAFEEAEPLLDRAVRIASTERGEAHDDLAFMLANLALARQGLGRVEEAEGLFERARVVAATHAHRMLAPVLVDLAAIACLDGRLQRGVDLLAEARPIMQRDYPTDAWRLAWIDSVNAECLWLGGDRDQGARLLAGATPELEQRWTADSLFGAELARRRHLIGAR
jgi:tetratricopeptide (TPR) repeat protein